MKFNRNVLILLFASSLILLGIITYQIIDSGFQSRDELFSQIALGLSSACSSVVFYMKLKKDKKEGEKTRQEELK